MSGARATDVDVRRAGLRGMAALAGREMRRVLALWTQTCRPS